MEGKPEYMNELVACMHLKNACDMSPALIFPWKIMTNRREFSKRKVQIRGICKWDIDNKNNL